MTCGNVTVPWQVANITQIDEDQVLHICRWYISEHANEIIGRTVQLWWRYLLSELLLLKSSEWRKTALQGKRVYRWDVYRIYFSFIFFDVCRFWVESAGYWAFRSLLTSDLLGPSSNVTAVTQQEASFQISGTVLLHLKYSSCPYWPDC